MIPRDTLYRLATKADEKRMHALMRSQGLTARLSWPTVIGERHGEIIGLLATQPRKEVLVAGPLVLAPHLPRPGIVIIRLGEAYEAVLRAAGVTLYHFHVEPHLRQWEDTLSRTGFEPFHRDDAGTWFRKKVA